MMILLFLLLSMCIGLVIWTRFRKLAMGLYSITLLLAALYFMSDIATVLNVQF